MSDALIAVAEFHFVHLPSPDLLFDDIALFLALVDKVGLFSKAHIYNMSIKEEDIHDLSGNRDEL